MADWPTAEEALQWLGPEGSSRLFQEVQGMSPEDQRRAFARAVGQAQSLRGMAAPAAPLTLQGSPPANFAQSVPSPIPQELVRAAPGIRGEGGAIPAQPVSTSGGDEGNWFTKAVGGVKDWVVNNREMLGDVGTLINSGNSRGRMGYAINESRRNREQANKAAQTQFMMEVAKHQSRLAEQQNASRLSVEADLSKRTQAMELGKAHAKSLADGLQQSGFFQSADPADVRKMIAMMGAMQSGATVEEATKLAAQMPGRIAPVFHNGVWFDVSGPQPVPLSAVTPGQAPQQHNVSPGGTLVETPGAIPSVVPMGPAPPPTPAGTPAQPGAQAPTIPGTKVVFQAPEKPKDFGEQAERLSVEMYQAPYRSLSSPQMKAVNDRIAAEKRDATPKLSITNKMGEEFSNKRVGDLPTGTTMVNKKTLEEAPFNARMADLNPSEWSQVAGKKGEQLEAVKTLNAAVNIWSGVAEQLSAQYGGNWVDAFSTRAAEFGGKTGVGSKLNRMQGMVLFAAKTFQGAASQLSDRDVQAVRDLIPAAGDGRDVVRQKLEVLTELMGAMRNAALGGPIADVDHAWRRAEGIRGGGGQTSTPGVRKRKVD